MIAAGRPAAGTARRAGGRAVSIPGPGPRCQPTTHEVALCRVSLGMTRPKAHRHAWEVHTTGASVVARAPEERAEHFQAQLAARGLRVTIEPD